MQRMGKEGGKEIILLPVEILGFSKATVALGGQSKK